MRLSHYLNFSVFDLFGIFQTPLFGRVFTHWPQNGNPEGHLKSEVVKKLLPVRFCEIFGSFFVSTFKQLYLSCSRLSPKKIAEKFHQNRFGSHFLHNLSAQKPQKTFKTQNNEIVS